MHLNVLTHCVKDDEQDVLGVGAEWGSISDILTTSHIVGPQNVHCTESV